MSTELKNNLKYSPEWKVDLEGTFLGNADGCGLEEVLADVKLMRFVRLNFKNFVYETKNFVCLCFCDFFLSNQIKDWILKQIQNGMKGDKKICVFVFFFAKKERRKKEKIIMKKIKWRQILIFLRFKFFVFEKILFTFSFLFEKVWIFWSRNFSFFLI